MSSRKHRNPSAVSVTAWLATALMPCTMAGALGAQTPDPGVEHLLAALADPDPARAVPAQVGLLAHNDAMARLGEVVEKGWKGEGGDWVRWRAIEVLNEARARGAPALPALIASLRGGTLPDSWCGSVLAAVGRIGLYAPERRDLMSKFSASLWPYSGDTMDRADAGRIHGLGVYLQVDGAGATGEELLAHLLESEARIVRAALHALADRADGLSVGRRTIVERLVEWIEDPGVRSARRVDRGLLTDASGALRAFAPRHPDTWLAWCQDLYHWEPARRIAAARALAELRSHHALPWLARAARQAPEDVALAILGAIRGYGAVAAPVAPLLAPLVSSSSARVGAEARGLMLALAPELAASIGDDREPVLELVGCGLEKAPQKALEAWLDGARGANRARVLADPSAIREYDAEATGLRWVPMRVFPDPADPWKWSGSGFEIPGAVLVSPKEAIGEGWRRVGDAPWLVYLLPAPLDRPVIPALVRFLGTRTSFAIGCEPQHRPAWRDMADDATTVVLCVDGVAVHSGSAKHMSGTGDGWYAFYLVDQPWLDREFERLRAVGGR